MIDQPQEVISAASRIAAAVAESSAADSGLGDAVTRLCEGLECSALGVWTLDETRRALELVSGSPESAHNLPAVVTQAESPTLTAASDAQLVHVTGGQWPGDSSIFGAAGYAAGLVVPLRWQGTVNGVLGLFDRDPARSFDSAAAAIEVVGPVIAAALAQRDRSQRKVEVLHGALEAERDELLHVQAATRQMLEQANAEANLQVAVEAIQGLGWRQVALVLFSGADGQIDNLFSVGLDTERAQAYGEEIVPQTIWEQLVTGELDQCRTSGLYCVMTDDPGSDRWQPSDMVVATLRVGQGDIVGLIRLDDPADGRRPSPGALRAVDILANQVAYIVENARLLDRISQSAETLSEQVEELSMMHRADRELSTHLDVERIMRLTMDWALRRTTATTGLLMLMTQDRRGMIPSVTMGALDRTQFTYDEQQPFPVTLGVIGRTARTGETQVIRDVQDDPDYISFFPQARSYIAVPMAMRGEVLGVVTLASDRLDAFDQADVSFLERLARRAAVAFDNARLLRQSEQLADDMSVIYTASRTITSTLERDEILKRIAQAMAVALECSSTVIFDYSPEAGEAQVLTVYRLGTAHDSSEKLPAIKHTMPVDTFPAFQTAIEQQHPLVLRTADPALLQADRRHLLDDNIHVMVLIPLVAQNELIGLASVIEGRYDRQLTSNDVFKVETLAGQAAIALRQSMLYNEVLELEKLKSEMIRMASHDLRNPLNNIMGYIELLAFSIDQRGATPDESMYIENLRRGTTVMQSLLEDLLTLERIESERQNEWANFDLGALASEVVDEQRGSADLKHHTLILNRPEEPLTLCGSVTQMRQAISNLVGNAIKYTPENGQIEVRVRNQAGRLELTVEDNGFGISPERQVRIFQRFYRAHEPGTEHIGGTGLGLSLVKTVVERHGGDVWFESTSGVGSEFGFWVPAANVTNHADSE